MGAIVRQREVAFARVEAGGENERDRNEAAAHAERQWPVDGGGNDDDRVALAVNRR